MMPQDRAQLLALVDVVCEGLATEEQCAALEQLVLSNPQALKLYVSAVHLHGTLHWDAAGIGDVCQAITAATPAEPVRNPAQQPVARRRWTGLVASGLALSLAVWAFVSLQSRPDQSAAAPSVADNSPDVPVVVPVPDQIPVLRLPGERTHVGPVADPVVKTVIDPPQIDVPVEPLVQLIDRELASTWRDQGVVAGPTATDAEWLRRVTLDLAGRIPTLSEAESFLANTATDKREQTLVRLLDGSEFPRHLAMIWTNLLVGRAPSGESDRQGLEDYLARQFAGNQPWSETVTQLVAAEGSPEENGAVNFLLAHLNNEAVPATAVTARVLLGEQLQCAQCHVHPQVASWGQERFWQMNACFQQTHITERLLVDQETGERTTLRELVNEPGTAGSFYETLQGEVKVAYPGFDGQEQSLDPQANRRQFLVEHMLSGDHSAVARNFVNRTWAHLLGAGFTVTPDDFGPHTSISHPRLLEDLTRRFVSSGYNVRELVGAICRSQAYQLSSHTEGSELDDPEQGMPLFSRGYVKPMSPEQTVHSLLIASGKTPGDLHRAGGLQQRQEWLGQFFSAEETEENAELCTFDGSLPQALTLMNGALVQQVVQGTESELPTRIIDEDTSDVEKIRQLSLAALGRYPSPQELQSVRQVLRGYVHQRTSQNVSPRVAVNEGYRDLYWAYLNSSEFSQIR